MFCRSHLGRRLWKYNSPSCLFFTSMKSFVKKIQNC